ncbi:hypothetical protein [Salinactinospora qingdaonensis]
MSTKNGANLETVLLAVRLAVAALAPRMPAFDLAFLRYWEDNHPGEPLDEYLRRHTLLSRYSSNEELRAQMESAVQEAAQTLTLPGLLGGLATSGIRALVTMLRERHSKARALAGCNRLPDLLEATPDLDALSYYPHLLAWDLEQLPHKRRAQLVVLLDTFEDVSNRPDHELERLIQRMAWLMPATLFVFTGRDRLRWDDESLEGQLDWVGVHHWPQLLPGVAAPPARDC